jgi:gliding motility-associated-like protein
MQKRIVTLILLTFLYIGFAFAQGENSIQYKFIETNDQTGKLTVQFSANAPRGTSGFVWSFGQDGATSTDENPTFVYNILSESVFIVTLFYEGLNEPVSSVINIQQNNLNSTKISKAVAADFADIPNVITPNGDGVNDYFSFETPEASRLSFKVFSRSGSVIYEKEANLIHWDGKNYYGQDIADGVYYYILVDLDGLYKTAKGFFYIYR